MAELGKKTTVNGIVLPDDAPANPCGLVAKSYFTDSYLIASGPKGTATTPTTANNVYINDTNIAWESDRLYKFKNLQLPGQPADAWKSY